MAPVLQVRVSRLDIDPSLLALCPGYEATVWRDTDLARDVFDRHLASFALTYTDVSAISDTTAAALLRKAAKAVYNTDKYAKRGEFGELFLHAICRDVFKSEPAISKISFKDSANDTVKGFDSVHVVIGDNQELELWLGEVKFYSNLSAAIRDVTAELVAHLDAGYLRGEFVAVPGKLDPAWAYTDRVRTLLDENVSLDDVFDVLTVPVLLTYESAAVDQHEVVDDAYIEALTDEAQAAWDSFSSRLDADWNVTIRLLLMPLKSKQRLSELMHERLAAWQQV